MKAYSQFLKELPSKKIVFAFGRFQPPTTGHELLVRAVERLASTHNASHVIYASRTQDKTKNPLPVDRKVYYLKRMFPTAKFMAAGPSTRTFIEVAKELNKKHKDIIMVAGSDRVVEYTKLLNQYNGKEFNFNTIQVVSAGERDPDSDDATGMSGTKMREAAKKGDFDTFKKGLPTTLTTMDGRRLMNEIRQAMGLDVVKEQVTVTDWLRESYHRGEILKVGQIVESNGERYEIIDRGSNYLTVVDTSGNTHRKWLHNVTVVEDYQETEDTSDFSYKNYKPQNIKHPQVIAAFSRLTSRDDVDPVAVLNALKSTDEYHFILNKAVEYDEISEEEVDQFNSSIQMAQEYLMKLGELQHHADYINHAIHDIDQVRAQYHMEKEEGMEESMKTFKELIEMKFSSSDKIKVARIIADALGVPDVEKSSSADQLVNNALRKIRNKPMRPEYMSVLKNMLQTAREAGINYDEKLVPGKIEEVDLSENAPFKKLDQAVAYATDKVKTHRDNLDGIEVYKHKAGGYDVNHTMNSNGRNSLHKSGAKHLGTVYKDKPTNIKEETLDEISSKLAGDYYGAATKKHIAKVGVKPNMYGRIEKDMGKQRKAGVDRAMDRITGARKTNEEYEQIIQALEEAISTIDKGEYDYEGAMARTQLQTVVRNSQELINMLSMDDNMPEWVQSKITLAQDYISSVRDYLKSREELGEATAYYNKPSFLKKMSRIAKQERQAREKKEAEQKKQVKEESSSVYDNHIKGHSDYGSIVKKHGVIKTKQIIRHLKTERESMRKSDWAGPAHLKKHDYAIRGLSRALGEEKVEYEEHEQSTYDDSKFVVGDTGKLTYDAMKRFLGIQNVSDLENLKNKSSFTMTQKRYMHEETEEEDFDEEDFDDDITSMSEPEHIIDAYDDEEFAIVDDESGEELDTDGYEEEDKEEEAKIKEGKIIILEISRMERIRRKQRFARTKSKREVRAQIALRRTSNQTTINKRARRLATAMIKRRLLRKDPNKATLPEKERVERFLQTRKALVDRLSRRVAPRIRQIEKSRLQHKKFTK